jgi:hypothetical protein
MPGYPVTVTAGEGIDQSWIDAQVAVTIVTGTTADPVLAVPLAAVQTGSDGATYVTVSQGSTTRQVSVTTGFIADGLVEVTPATGVTLQAGDDVVVG